MNNELIKKHLGQIVTYIHSMRLASLVLRGHNNVNMEIRT